MFDTIHVKPPLRCPACDAEVASLQTKDLSDSMAHFKIGSVLRAAILAAHQPADEFAHD